jgi:hypothetical protein
MLENNEILMLLFDTMNTVRIYIEKHTQGE